MGSVPLQSSLADRGHGARGLQLLFVTGAGVTACHLLLPRTSLVRLQALNFLLLVQNQRQEYLRKLLFFMASSGFRRHSDTSATSASLLNPAHEIQKADVSIVSMHMHVGQTHPAGGRDNHGAVAAMYTAAVGVP